MALTDERGRVVASNAAARDFLVAAAHRASRSASSPPTATRLREWLAAARDARGLLQAPRCRCAATTAARRRATRGDRRRRRPPGSSRPAAPLRSRESGAHEQRAPRRRGTLPRAVRERRPRHLPLPCRRHHPRRQPRAGRDARARARRHAGRPEARRRRLRRAGRLPHPRRSHPPRRARAQRRRQLDAAATANRSPCGSRAASRPAAAPTASSSCWSRTRPSAGRSKRSSRTPPRWSRSGRLAGGIAHDFNNLLTAILGYVDLMQGSLSEQDPIARHALQIRRSAERASLLTRQLLAFSRKQFLQPRVIDLNAVVEESSQMLRRLISEHIELVRDARSAAPAHQGRSGAAAAGADEPRGQRPRRDAARAARSASSPPTSTCRRARSAARPISSPAPT